MWWRFLCWEALNSGQFIVEYTAFVGQGGTQIIIARIQLQIPPEFFAICPLISDDDGLIEVVLVITQTVAAAHRTGALKLQCNI